MCVCVVEKEEEKKVTRKRNITPVIVWVWVDGKLKNFVEYTKQKWKEEKRTIHSQRLINVHVRGHVSRINPHFHSCFCRFNFLFVSLREFTITNISNACLSPPQLSFSFIFFSLLLGTDTNAQALTYTCKHRIKEKNNNNKIESI